MGVSEDNSYFQQHLSLCGTLQRTAAVIASDILVFAQLAFVTVGAYVLVWSCLLLILVRAFGLDVDQLYAPDYVMTNPGPIYAMTFINMVVFLVMTAVGNGALIQAVAEGYVHRRPRSLACIQVGVRHFIEIAEAGILAYLGVCLGFLCLILPGFYVLVKWLLINPAIIIEGLGPIAAMNRSWNLVSDHWCSVFSIWFIMFAFGTSFHLLWSHFFTVNAYTISGTIVGSIPSFIVNPIIAVMMAIVYINLRIEKEGLNVEAFSRELGIEGDYGAFIDPDHEAGTGKKEVATSNLV